MSDATPSDAERAAAREIAQSTLHYLSVHAEPSYGWPSEEVLAESYSMTIARHRYDHQKVKPSWEGTTHYEGCWRNRGHHACAIERVKELEIATEEAES